MNRTEALAASDSFDVGERLKSIVFVAMFEDDECMRAVVRLLTDENVEVCAEMGKHLLQKNELSAAELLFTGIAISDEQQRFRTLWEIKNASHFGEFEIERFGREILDKSNFLARCGLRDVLEWLHIDALD